MKEGTLMKEMFLDQIRIRLNYLDELIQQIDDTGEQFFEKSAEIDQFRQEWQLNCKHVFYKKVKVEICTPITLGYHCCLCGKEEKPKKKPQKYIDIVRFPYYCTESGKVDLFPIPPEYQSEVDRKKEQLDKLLDEKKDLYKRFLQLREEFDTTKEDLRDVAYSIHLWFHFYHDRTGDWRRVFIPGYKE